MKPIVYFDFKECNEDKNSVVITKDRLKEILEEVYQAGYTDGNANKTTITTTPWNWRDDITCHNNIDSTLRTALYTADAKCVSTTPLKEEK